MIVTEWNEFRSPDWDEMKKLMKRKVIFDGRNLFDPKAVRKLGFTYYCIGREAVGLLKPMTEKTESTLSSSNQLDHSPQRVL